MRRLASWLEVLGGARGISRPSAGRTVALALWWAVLILAVYATIGRGTKFIYVDF